MHDTFLGAQLINGPPGRKKKNIKKTDRNNWSNTATHPSQLRFACQLAPEQSESAEYVVAQIASDDQRSQCLDGQQNDLGAAATSECQTKAIGVAICFDSHVGARIIGIGVLYGQNKCFDVLVVNSFAEQFALPSNHCIGSMAAE